MTGEIWNRTRLDSFLATAYDQFFFLITERLDESLLLLKNAWGWTLKDIVYLLFLSFFIFFLVFFVFYFIIILEYF